MRPRRRRGNMRKTIRLLGVSALVLVMLGGCVPRRQTAGRLPPRIGKEPAPEFTAREAAVLETWDLTEPTLFRKIKGYSDANAARLEAYETQYRRPVTLKELRKHFTVEEIELVEPGLTK